MSFNDILTNNPNKKKINITINDLSVNNIIGLDIVQSQIIPWTSFGYFVSGNDIYEAWYATDQNNGKPYTGDSRREFIPSKLRILSDGEYRFTCQFVKDSTNGGIIQFTINDFITDIDPLLFNYINNSYTWTQELRKGEYSIGLNSLNKNDSSSDYWLVFLGSGLIVDKV